MLIQARFREAIARGDVTLTFRRWRRCQVVAGRVYRTAAGRIHIDAVDVVDPDRITARDVRAAGFESRADLFAALRGPADLPVYRIRLHAAADDDPRDTLAAIAVLSDEERAALDVRLDRLDRAAGTGRGRARCCTPSRRGRPCEPPTSRPTSAGRRSLSSSTCASSRTSVSRSVSNGATGFRRVGRPTCQGSTEMTSGEVFGRGVEHDVENRRVLARKRGVERGTDLVG